MFFTGVCASVHSQGGSARRNAYENTFWLIAGKQTLSLVFNGGTQNPAISGMVFGNQLGSQ